MCLLTALFLEEGYQGFFRIIPSLPSCPTLFMSNFISPVMAKVRNPPRILLLCALFVSICDLLRRAQAAAAVTDPTEVEALRRIAQKWNIESSVAWNLTGDPCTGPAIDNTQTSNPGIKCDCTFNNETTCHVTQMKVFGLNVKGGIPEELGNLTFLWDLDLRENYLTGSIPAFLGSLTAMRYLSLGTNKLSGPVPKELGNLSALVSLSFASNSLNGTLPPELGNLAQLQELYMGNAGVSGKIPSSFRKLTNLKKFWAHENQFTGKIPDFVGDWTDLTELRFQGNAFEGPIPSSFSNLTSLTNLRISDITSEGSSLTFLQNLKNLTQLVLRNNMISGEIPSDIGELHQLIYLDLSFNDLTGEIPDSIQNLNVLQFLFLGNNNLSGELPSQKGASLTYMDLSYNLFSGAFPTWINDQNLKMNLVGNYFKINATKNGLASTKFACLQRDFPCNKGAPRYSKFAINCGGPQVTSSGGIVFEPDNETLNAASFYVSDEEKWGVSSAGYFMDSENPSYVRTSQSQFANTLDSTLFQTARASPSSLRYYGLGLQNGAYTVSLQFAEIEFPDTETWESLGRRIFDVHIQGRKVLSDFNIRKEAGGSNVALVRPFKAIVTENVLEIHFFWTGKGTYSIPTHATYGPLVSAISVESEFTPTVSNTPLSSFVKKTIHKGTVIGIIIGVTAAGLICLSSIICWRRNQKPSSMGGEEDEAFRSIEAKPNIFSYSEMRTATRDFDLENKLGEGGFGAVYKGILPDGKVVAVKQLSSESRQGKREFINEVASISAVQHRNLVKLHGCCLEGDRRLLVYEYLQNNSLAEALFGSRKCELQLDWPTRYNICVGTARGLSYLHEESRIRIVHRDIKASNILLDENLNPKIADFGLAKLYDEEKTHISTRVAGTVGYLAPEYCMRGHLTEKADVFSFGVVLLEIISGRRNSETNLPDEMVYLLEWTWHLHEQNRLIELVDPTLASGYSNEEVQRVIQVALLCTQAAGSMRPSMSRVVAMITGDVEIIPVTSRPGYITDWEYNNVLAEDRNRSSES